MARMRYKAKAEATWASLELGWYKALLSARVGEVAIVFCFGVIRRGLPSRFNRCVFADDNRREEAATSFIVRTRSYFTARLFFRFVHHRQHSPFLLRDSLPLFLFPSLVSHPDKDAQTFKQGRNMTAMNNRLPISQQ